MMSMNQDAQPAGYMAAGSTVHPAEVLSGNYLEMFYNVLFHPVRTYRAVAEERSDKGNLLLFGLLTIVYISALAPVIHAAAKGAVLAALVVQIPLQVVAGLGKWLFMGLVVGLLSYVFTGHSRLKVFLILSAFATMPWVFMGPISLLQQNLGGFAGFLVLLAGLAVWVWSVFLFVLAITMTYRLTVEKTALLLAMPLLMTLVFLAWSTGFVVNILRLLPA